MEEQHICLTIGTYRTVLLVPVIDVVTQPKLCSRIESGTEDYTFPTCWSLEIVEQDGHYSFYFKGRVKVMDGSTSSKDFSTTNYAIKTVQTLIGEEISRKIVNELSIRNTWNLYNDVQGSFTTPYSVW